MLDNFSQVKKRLEATETWFYRRMLGITWTEHVSNDNILKKTETVVML